MVVEVHNQNLVAIILGGSTFSHPANSSLILDASQSRDPDNPSTGSSSIILQIQNIFV